MEILIFENEEGLIDIWPNNLMPTHEEIDKGIGVLKQYKQDYSSGEIDGINQQITDGLRYEEQIGRYEVSPSKETRRKPLSNGYVYAIRTGKLVKIGHTKRPAHRMKLYRTENPYPIEVLYMVKVTNCRHVEAAIRVGFVSKQVRGEWFDLTDEDIGLIGVILQENAV